MENKQTKTIYRCNQVKNSIFVGIITARGGSKGIPFKNIYPVCGKPLIQYTIESAIGCGFLNRIIVSTDHAEIKRISLSLGIEVFDRSEELSSDLALSTDVVINVLKKLEVEGAMPDYFVLLQPTSPLRQSWHVKEAVEAFMSSNCKSCISVTEAEYSPYKMMKLEDEQLKPLFGIENLHAPRQLLPKLYRQNGAIYISSCRDFLEYGTFFIQPVYPYVMQLEESVDIDNFIDIIVAEYYLKTCIHHVKNCEKKS
ncbi:MAG: acylneuraminate cytidylyltransferase family protein [Syntrophomonadaceae bacterium]|nr:acylneuraminate cytidylyltransferase family protein [Syntrophomonadaceae bacterium]